MRDDYQNEDNRIQQHAKATRELLAKAEIYSIDLKLFYELYKIDLNQPVSTNRADTSLNQDVKNNLDVNKRSSLSRLKDFPNKKIKLNDYNKSQKDQSKQGNESFCVGASFLKVGDDFVMNTSLKQSLSTAQISTEDSSQSIVYDQWPVVESEKENVCTVSDYNIRKESKMPVEVKGIYFCCILFKNEFIYIIDLLFSFPNTDKDDSGFYESIATLIEQQQPSPNLSIDEQFVRSKSESDSKSVGLELENNPDYDDNDHVSKYRS